jgi:uncharacterized protein (DUF433 family)
MTGAIGLGYTHRQVPRLEAESTGDAVIVPETRMEVRPAVLLGKPVIPRTRIPVELVVRELGEAATEGDQLDAYPRLGREDIQAALASIRRLARHARGRA